MGINFKCFYLYLISSSFDICTAVTVTVKQSLAMKFLIDCIVLGNMIKDTGDIH